MQPWGPYRNFPQSCYTEGTSAKPDIDDFPVPRRCLSSFSFLLVEWSLAVSTLAEATGDRAFKDV